jgi:transposase
LKQIKETDLNQLSKTELIELISKLYGVIQDLEDRVNQNSKNSSKPPSSDGYNKPAPKSRREKTGKSIGGQLGHKGSTLMQVSVPDLIKIHKVLVCEKCGSNLENDEPIRHECRQEFDIVRIKSRVVEHRGEVKLCTTCLHNNTAIFPKNINHATQYGVNVKAYATYLNQYQFIPFKRLQEMFQDCFNLQISQGSLVNFNAECSNKLAHSMDAIKNTIINSKVAHFDETSMHINGKIHWLHVASTKISTHYAIDSKRGNIAMDKIGILPKLQGTATHDYWKPYLKYNQCRHSLCNAHHLRELEFIYDRYKQTWAQKMLELLLEINTTVASYKQEGKTKLLDTEIRSFESKYEQIIAEGFKEFESYPSSHKKQQELSNRKADNLLDRFNLKNYLILRFMYDFDVEFTNNLAEQDIRMCKVKSKISGSFRSAKGSSNFAIMRSYISTLRKNNQNILEALSNAFCNIPFIPSCP